MVSEVLADPFRREGWDSRFPLEVGASQSGASFAHRLAFLEGEAFRPGWSEALEMLFPRLNPRRHVPDKALDASWSAREKLLGEIRHRVSSGHTVCIDTSVPFSAISRSPLLHHDYIELLALVPPEHLRIVVLERDPRRLSISVWRRALERNIVKACHSVEYAVLYTSLCRRLSPVDVHSVRYENLVSDPHQVCQNLGDYLEIPIKPTDMARVQDPHESSVPHDISRFVNHFWTKERMWGLGWAS